MHEIVAKLKLTAEQLENNETIRKVIETVDQVKETVGQINETVDRTIKEPPWATRVFLRTPS
jgi:hypothetical protein